MTSSDNATAGAAAPLILLAEDGEPVDGQPAADPPDAPPEDPDAPPEDPDALPIPRPLLIEV